MPCYDGGVDIGTAYVNEHKSAQKLKELEAMLCGVMNLLEDYYCGNLDGFDEKESGVDRTKLLKWWEDHKAEDAARELKEQKIKEKQELKKQALSKLTDKEKKVLGL